MYKQFLMMRARGISGPNVGNKVGWTGLVKSVGNYITLNAVNPLILFFSGLCYAKVLPALSFSDGWLWEFDVNTKTTTEQILFGGNATTDYEVKFAINDGVNISTLTFTSQGVAHIWTGLNLSINTDFTISLELSGVGSIDLELFIDGVSQGIKQIVPVTGTVGYFIGADNTDTSPFYIGQINRVSLQNWADPSTSLSWTLDSGSLVYEPSEEHPNDRSKDLEYVYVTADDWKRGQ